MKQIAIINGPNLNMLGKREKDIYGNISFESFLKKLCNKYKGTACINYYQSSYEGAIIDQVHKMQGYDGIILNAGALSHTSIAIQDAIKCINSPVIEVHISNIYKRESFRHKSFLASCCKGVIIGLGLSVYELALMYLINNDLLPEN